MLAHRRNEFSLCEFRAPLRKDECIVEFEFGHALADAFGLSGAARRVEQNIRIVSNDFRKRTHIAFGWRSRIFDDIGDKDRIGNIAVG